MYLTIMHCRSSNRGYGGQISMHSSVGMGHLKTGVDITREMAVIQNIPHIQDNVQHNFITMNHLLLQIFRQRSALCSAETALRYTTQMGYRFGHQKAVLLRMGIIMLETC
jgi:hypothetical protein